MYQKIFLGLLLVFLGANCVQAEVQVFAHLEQEEFYVNQPTRLILTVQGVHAAAPQIPAIEGLHLSLLGQNMQSQLINGQHSSSITFTYLVQADQAGTYTIEPLQVQVQGKVYLAPALTCTVLPGQSPQGQGAGDRLRPDEVEQMGFMEISTPKERIYIGQILPFTLKASFRSGQRIHITSLPRLVGENFLLHSLDQEPQQVQEEINGELYITLIWEGRLSAVKEGNLALSTEIHGEVLKRERSGNPFFGMDDFFEDLFSRYSRREFKISSPKKHMRVQALPTEGRPADFHGAIGSFSLAVALAPTEARVGDPLTLTMKLTGQGNFDQVQAPELTHSEGWRVYPASARLERREKIFEQAVTPVDQHLTALPALRFSYFDPELEEYMTLHSDPIPLNIHGLDENLVPQPSEPNIREERANPAPHQRLAPPKLNPGEMVQQVQPVYAKMWFILVAGAAVSCLSVGLLLDLRRRQRIQNPHLYFSKQMEREVHKHLQEMRAALHRKDQEGFRWHGLRAIQKQASTVLAITPEAITLADIQAWLEGENLPLVEIFAQLEQSSYAGAVFKQEDMESILASVTQELKQRR
jgi:hypothetical protein